jgi:hypothetical protein
MGVAAAASSGTQTREGQFTTRFLGIDTDSYLAAYIKVYNCEGLTLISVSRLSVVR